MTEIKIMGGVVLTGEHAEFYTAARAFVVSGFIDRTAAPGARRKAERAFSAMKRSEAPDE